MPQSTPGAPGSACQQDPAQQAHACPGSAAAAAATATSSSSNSSSRTRYYRSASASLNGKLQHYRDDRVALAELHARIREHAHRKATAAAAAAAAAVVSGAAASGSRPGSARPASAGRSQPGAATRPGSAAAAVHSRQQQPACSLGGSCIGISSSGSTRGICNSSSGGAMLASSQAGTAAASAGVRSSRVCFSLEGGAAVAAAPDDTRAAPGKHVDNKLLPQLHQDTASLGGGSLQAARQQGDPLARLTEQVGPLLRPHLPAQQTAARERCARRLVLLLQQQHGSVSTLAQLAAAARQLQWRVALIQCCWRATLAVRAAQEQLLCRALQQLEGHLLRRNTAADADAVRAAAAAAASSGQPRQQQRDATSGSRDVRAQPAGPGLVRGGGPLVRPADFFLAEEEGIEQQREQPGQAQQQASQPARPTTARPGQRPRPAAVAGKGAGGSITAAAAGGNQRVPQAAPPAPAPSQAQPAAAGEAQLAGVQAAAAALPSGRMPARGVQMSGQLTPPPARMGSRAAAVAAVGAGQEGSVDLEVEAALRSLRAPLPDDVRLQVVRRHLCGARRQLAAVREAHAAALACHVTRRQLLQNAGVADADASPPPAPPSLRRLPARPTLKLLVLEGMQLVEAAAAAEKDT